MAETPTLTRTDRRARRLTKLALAAAIGLAIGNRRGTDPRLLLVLEAHDLDRAVGTRSYRRWFMSHPGDVANGSPSVYLLECFRRHPLCCNASRRRRCVTFAARSSHPCFGCGPSVP